MCIRDRPWVEPRGWVGPLAPGTGHVVGLVVRDAHWDPLEHVSRSDRICVVEERAAELRTQVRHGRRDEHHHQNCEHGQHSSPVLCVDTTCLLYTSPSPRDS
eukprot:TRINITY_DN28432_c0_g1_i1.p2 TRINITY_DN28432_c0_g1~~TRINITY_DN28432_c0_g1_i1.p2  ORF type:complete len:102 (+),score=6.06 TRINITY_DN28432_c0_g1_i1:172-477(+)